MTPTEIVLYLQAGLMLFAITLFSVVKSGLSE